MAILKVAHMGHPVLRAKARTIEAAEIRSPAVQQLIDDMFETMSEYQGVGLAAPQIHESVRLFVAGFPRDEEDADEDEQTVPQMALINPEIRGRVPRARQIVVRAYDRTGKRMEIKASGFTARVIQHETDHLDGVLFFDRMKSLESLTFLPEFSRYWSGRDIREE